jgi:hypothetical protein
LYAQEHVFCGGVDSAAGNKPENSGTLIGEPMPVLLKGPA